MEFEEKDFKNISIGLMILGLTVLAFFLIKPIISAILGGLVLAYMFTPIYKRLKRAVGNPSASAFIVSFLVLIIIFLPLWFLIPKIIEQLFNVLSASQTINFQSAIKSIFPNAQQEFISQVSLATNNFVNNAGSTVINLMGELFFNLPTISLQLLATAFVFFFALRDSDKLKEFVEGLSPFSKSKEGFFVRQFKDVTDSVVYGIIIVGLVQGLIAGFGLFIFGVPNAIILTILAIFFSIIPFIGPSIIWIPVNVYLFSTHSTSIGVAYLLYNIIIVSTIDNVLRSYIISRKTNISTAVATIGIIGGALLFGMIGLIIGPLVLAYLITFLKAYKEKRIYSLFYED